MLFTVSIWSTPNAFSNSQKIRITALASKADPTPPVSAAPFLSSQSLKVLSVALVLSGVIFWKISDTLRIVVIMHSLVTPHHNRYF